MVGGCLPLPPPSSPSPPTHSPPPSLPYPWSSLPVWVGTNGGLYTIQADKKQKLLVVEDNGIGMNRSELISNLGTVASSGTAKFLSQVASGQADASLIGHFGVGFYSSFLVADAVEVSSRKLGQAEVHRWSSDAGGSFSVETVSGASKSSHFGHSNDLAEGLLSDVRSGSRVVLKLKEEADEYLEDYKIKEMLRKYSEFVSFPIEVRKQEGEL
eukprot:GHVU01025349.1.p2 GENE.GHVU01025349.1~~GHVU01025349.1.p2  ORF type:complete len:213 (-),score=38.84 GHVU01025349.1:27-665(-)